MNAFPIIVTYTTDSESFPGSSDKHANPCAFGKAQMFSNFKISNPLKTHGVNSDVTTRNLNFTTTGASKQNPVTNYLYFNNKNYEVEEGERLSNLHKITTPKNSRAQI